MSPRYIRTTLIQQELVVPSSMIIVLLDAVKDMRSLQAWLYGNDNRVNWLVAGHPEYSMSSTAPTGVIISPSSGGELRLDRLRVSGFAISRDKVIH